MKLIIINDRFLNVNDVFKESFIKQVIHTMNQKFEGTNVHVVHQDTQIENLSGIDSAKSVLIHNDPSKEISGGSEALGVSNGEYAEVNVADFNFEVLSSKADMANSLAKQVGTVAAHESYHLYGPSGHSLESNNLMSDGTKLDSELFEKDGIDLEFTQLQKEALKSSETLDGLSLAEVESEYSQFKMTNMLDTDDNLDLDDINSTHLGDFDLENLL
jgi:hypothetical protein